MGYTIPFYAYTMDRFGSTAGRTTPHRGHDVAPGGNLFPSWVSGTVVVAGYQSCLGYRVVIRNDADGHYVGVSHLVGAIVRVGQWVTIGTGLGYIGATGTCQKGRHAHITVSPSSMYPESGPVIDPVAYANNGSAPAGGGSGAGFGLSYEAQLSLQRAMSHVGRYAGPHDGKFGPVCVRAMQQWLIDLGYLPWTYNIDGIPGASYGKALQELARDKGGYTGPIDGALGARSSAGLIHWAEVVVIQNGGGDSTSWAYGLNMEAQRKLQAALKHLGYYGGVIDGVFGPRTVAAMQAYLVWRELLPKTYGIDGKPGVLYGRAMQELATAHGYTGAIDGVIGDRTSTALIAFADSVLGTTPTPAPPPVDQARRWPLGGTFGIDVASPQRDLDFGRAKADGAEFAIVKMGGLNVLPQYQAPFYRAQIDRARAAGLKIGHYYLIGLGQTPEEQAAFMARNLHDFRVDEDVLALDNERLDSNGTLWNDAAAARFARELHRLTGIPYARFWHYGGAHDYRTLQPFPELDALEVTYWWAAYGSNSGRYEDPPALDLNLPRPAINPTDDRLVHQFSSLLDLAGYKLDGNWSAATVDELFARGTITEPDPIPEPEPEPTPTPDPLEQLKWTLAPIAERIRLAADELESALGDDA